MVGWSADGPPRSHPGGQRGLQEGQQPQEDEPGSGSLQGRPGQALCAQLCPQGMTVTKPASESANATLHTQTVIYVFFNTIQWILFP